MFIYIIVSKTLRISHIYSFSLIVAGVERYFMIAIVVEESPKSEFEKSMMKGFAAIEHIVEALATFLAR